MTMELAASMIHTPGGEWWGNIQVDGSKGICKRGKLLSVVVTRKRTVGESTNHVSFLGPARIPYCNRKADIF